MHFVCKFVELSYFQRNLEVAPIQSSIWWKGWCEYFPFDNWFSCIFWPCFVDFEEVFLPLTLTENCCFSCNDSPQHLIKLFLQPTYFKRRGAVSWWTSTSTWQHIHNCFSTFHKKLSRNFVFRRHPCWEFRPIHSSIPWTHHWWATKRNAFWY